MYVKLFIRKRASLKTKGMIIIESSIQMKRKNPVCVRKVSPAGEKLNRFSRHRVTLQAHLMIPGDEYVSHKIIIMLFS